MPYSPSLKLSPFQFDRQLSPIPMDTDEGFLCLEWEENMIQFAPPVPLSLCKLLPKYSGTASSLCLLKPNESTVV